MRTVILILIATSCYSQLAPKPTKFSFSENRNYLPDSVLIKLKTQIDSTFLILKLHNLKYKTVSISSYDSIYSIELDKNNYKKFVYIKKQIIKYGVKRRRIKYTPHFFDKEKGLEYYGVHWKLAFLL